MPKIKGILGGKIPRILKLLTLIVKEVPIIRRKNTLTNNSVKKEIEILTEQNQYQIISFENAKEEFIRHCRIKGLAEDTTKFYIKELKQVMRSLAEVNVPLDDIRKIKDFHIESFIEHQQFLGRAINTINSRLRAGRTFFNYCIRKKHIKKNPFDGIQQLRKRHEVGATFSKQQLKRLLDSPDITTFSGLRDLSIMLTFAHTGIRLSELTHKRIAD